MFTITPLKPTHLGLLSTFTDQEIGHGYYTATELRDIFIRSQKNGIMCSLVLENEQKDIVGVRICYPAGNWETGKGQSKGQGLHPEKWPHPLHDTAYFQSIFLNSAAQSQGWGRKLAIAALKLLVKTGAKGVACHSWKESPNNSSTRYLLKLGFELIAEHPHFWKAVQYNCSRCLKPPCQCTAQEMYLDLERNNEHLDLA